jgi:hypothetical protein
VQPGERQLSLQLEADGGKRADSGGAGCVVRRAEERGPADAGSSMIARAYPVLAIRPISSVSVSALPRQPLG